MAKSIKMKYIVIVADGMADLPLKELNYKTPLEVASTPNMDFLASNGRVGLLKTLSGNMPKTSEIANLSILGYSPKKYFPNGRGPLEAHAIDLKLKNGEIVIRTNFVNVENGILVHYSAGNISTKEGKILIDALNKNFSNEKLKFYQGEGYRGVLILRKKYSEKVKCWPPHEIINKKVDDYLPKALTKSAKKTEKILRELTLKSEKILSEHWINKKRVKEGKLKANMVWFWGIGKYRRMPSFEEKFKINGALISSVPLLKGIAKAIKLSVPTVPRANASLDTNYEGKADFALKELKRKGFVYLHLKAPDDLSHNGDFKGKIKAIEFIDKRVIGRILNKIKFKNFKIAVLADHTTSTELRKHTLDPVPFLIYSSKKKVKNNIEKYCERTAKKYGLIKAKNFMKIFLENA